MDLLPQIKPLVCICFVPGSYPVKHGAELVDRRPKVCFPSRGIVVAKHLGAHSFIVFQPCRFLTAPTVFTAER
jgi:hypothetical protein